jgi:protein tyrosine phosphatase (PTP) superfamily phosphohydrolase (DUF442 family)
LRFDRAGDILDAAPVRRIRMDRLRCATAAFALLAAIAACTADKPSAPVGPAAVRSAEPGDDKAAPPAPDVAIAPREVGRALASPRNDVPGAPNLAQVSPVLWRSAQPTAEGFKNLQAMGIRTVVNLRNFTSDRDELKGLGLRYHHIHFATWHAEDEDVVAFLKIVSDPANHPVLVHCQHGADRTGTMVAAYRVVMEGWTMEEAMQELPRFGFHSIWTNLKTYLQKFDAAAMKKMVDAAPAPKVEVVP